MEGTTPGGPQSRREPDPVTLAIGQAVQRHVLGGLGLPALPEGVTGIEGHPAGELVTGLVVTTADQGIRYFLVRVTEFAHGT
jgi:hypothetical protein